MTSDPSSWADLKAALANWLNRDDLSTTEIPQAIALAERRFQRTLFSPERDVETILAASAEAVALPTDLWAIRSVTIDADPRSVIEPVTLNVLRGRWPSAATGRPRNYAIRGETLLLAPAPDAEYDVALAYVRTIPALGEAQPTNWLLDDHPDLYLYGALHELHLLLADEARAGVYDGKFRQAAAEVNDSGVRRSQGGAPIRIRPPSAV